MKIDPYLNFPGTCEEAFRFYAEVLGGELVTMQTFADSPMADQVPADFASKILHARLELGDHGIMGSDASPDRYRAPQGIAVSVNVTDPQQAERIFGALAEGGQQEMPMAETFWALRFGSLTDRFGIPWMVNCDKPA